MSKERERETLHLFQPPRADQLTYMPCSTWPWGPCKLQHSETSHLGEHSYLWVLSSTVIACKRASEDVSAFHSHLGHQLRRACTLGPK